MEHPKAEGMSQRAPFTDIQNLQGTAQKSSAATKPSAKPPLGNNARAKEIGRKTLAAFKQRKADAAARRAADKAAAADAKGPASQSMSTGADAASPGTGPAGQPSARERVQCHAQTPSRIPALTHAGSASVGREAPRISAPTPTKIPSPPMVPQREGSGSSKARVLQSLSLTTSPKRHSAAGLRSYSTAPSPKGFRSMDSGLSGGQRNPLFENAAPRVVCPFVGPLAAGSSAHIMPLRAMHAPASSASSGAVSAGDSTATKLSSFLSAEATIMGAGSSGPQSVHSMASGLSRSGSLAFSTLSVLHENQAMKMEREELKTQINVISARLSVLEARSKSWGRIGQAPKGRSQSAPRGVPRSRIIASSSNAAERAAPALVCTSGQALASSEASGAKPTRRATTRPSSPRHGKGASFGSRPGSPARQRRAIVFGSRAPSPARSWAERSSASQIAAGSTVSKDEPQSRRQVPTISGQPAEPMQLPGNTPEAQQPSRPYRNAFMGGHMVGARRALQTSALHPAAPAADAEEAVKPDLSTAGPPAPCTGAACAALPSSVERWAGPGGRLSRTKLMRQTPRKEGKQKLFEEKENAADMVQPSKRVSKLAIAVAELGLEHAFRPRHA